jgi:uncharacterized membrane protein YdjX (TVP38/TMEM64 family)
VARAVAVALLVAVLAGTAGVALLPDVRAGLAHVVSLLAAGDLPGVREYLRGFGVWAPLVSAALVQVQAILAPLPSFPLMYANGLLFGTWWGGLLSWTSILLSALLCFGLARLLGRPLVERVASPGALAWADQHLTRYGPFALFIGRLIPLTAFDLLSYAAGLTRMRVVPFCVATGLGMAPSIFLAAAAGDVGWRSPWAWAMGLGGIAALAALVVLLRPAVLRWIESRSPETAGPGPL